METIKNHTDPFEAVEDKLERENPVGWRWPDRDGENDGSKLVGQYVADDRHDGHEVDIRLIRTRGTPPYRSMWLWPAKDGKPEPEWGLISRWQAAAPQIGDFVAVSRVMRPSLKHPGQNYADFTVVKLSADELPESDAEEVNGERPKF